MTTTKFALVGAWQLTVSGAPYKPHLIMFHMDGTLTITNPTNVQQSVDEAGHVTGTNDSVGMGIWLPDRATEILRPGRARYFIGTFVELNADARTHKPVDQLEVTFRVKMGSIDTFEGDALAVLAGQELPAKFDGVRIRINERALGKLPAVR